MIVETQSVRFDSISLDNGATLAPVEIAYESYGELNDSRSNAILTRMPPASATKAASRAGGTT
jgi:homoserine acetyltransferase